MRFPGRLESASELAKKAGRKHTGGPSPRRLPPDSGKRELHASLEPNRVRRYLKVLGPGLVTGASDDDPSGIATYATAGASFGFATLWTALVTFPMMAAVQIMCAKIGMASGMGLAGVLRRYYSPKLAYPIVFALVVANTITAGADIGAIAAGVNLIVPFPIPYLIVPVTLLILALLFIGSYRLIANVFQWLSLALLAYVGAALLAKPDWAAVLAGTLVPTLSMEPAFLATLVAILGTTISPYLFFRQASQEVEEELGQGCLDRRQRRHAALEHRHVLHDSGDGGDPIQVRQDERAVGGRRGDRAGARSPAMPRARCSPLASWGPASWPCRCSPARRPIVAEALGWRRGLNRPPSHAKHFYAVIALSMLVGMAINFLGINPIGALFGSAVLNGLIAPPVLVAVMLAANNPKVVGKRVNGTTSNVLGWLTAAAMFVAAVGMLVTIGR